MNEMVKKIESLQLKKDLPKLKTGDTICINFNIIDNKYKNRTQNFEGLILAIKKNGLTSTCTVRKLSYGEGIEKTFFVHSPTINFIKIKKHGIVRKSKLYYIKKLIGKASRIKEKTIQER